MSKICRGNLAEHAMKNNVDQPCESEKLGAKAINNHANLFSDSERLGINFVRRQGSIRFCFGQTRKSNKRGATRLEADLRPMSS
jgi:hypothetical protein